MSEIAREDNSNESPSPGKTVRQRLRRLWENDRYAISNAYVEQYKSISRSLPDGPLKEAYQQSVSQVRNALRNQDRQHVITLYGSALAASVGTGLAGLGVTLLTNPLTVPLGLTHIAFGTTVRLKSMDVLHTLRNTERTIAHTGSETESFLNLQNTIDSLSSQQVSEEILSHSTRTIPYPKSPLEQVFEDYFSKSPNHTKPTDRP